MKNDKAKQDTKTQYTPVEIEEIFSHLEKLSSSDVFSKSRKLIDFLSYIIREKILGREAQLKAVTIAQEVFDRGTEFDAQSDPIVRVEAGRLRRRLTEYYATEGVEDHIRFEVPKGAYKPLIIIGADKPEIEHENRPDAPKPSKATSERLSKPPASWRLSGRVLVSFAFILGCAMGIGLYWGFGKDHSTPAKITTQFTENPEAYAAFIATHSVGRPPHLAARVNAAIDLAQEAQKLDPTFGGGFAAEAFQINISVLFGHSKQPEMDLNSGLELAERAIAIDPEFAWGYQSKSRLLLLYTELDEAVTTARQAVDLAPDDAEQWGSLGLVLTIAGKANEAIDPISKAIELSNGAIRTPYLNYLGIAYFHNLEFEKSIEAIERNRDRGGPSGPHMLAYLTAAHSALGNNGRAVAYRKLIENDQTGFPLATFIDGFIVKPDQRKLLLKHLNMPEFG